jgi:hypothetical protein
LWAEIAIDSEDQQRREFADYFVAVGGLNDESVEEHEEYCVGLRYVGSSSSGSSTSSGGSGGSSSSSSSSGGSSSSRRRMRSIASGSY